MSGKSQYLASIFEAPSHARAEERVLPCQTVREKRRVPSIENDRMTAIRS